MMKNSRTYIDLFLESVENDMEYGKYVDKMDIAFEKKPVIDFAPEHSHIIFDLDVKANNGELEDLDIKTLNSWFRKHKDKAVRLYHATSSDFDILHQGLLPTNMKRAKSLQSGHGYVYLSYDPQRAKSFAQMAYPNKSITIYSIDVPIRKLLPDHDQLKNKRMYGGYEIGESLAESLLYGGGFKVKGKIDPWQIKDYQKL